MVSEVKKKSLIAWSLGQSNSHSYGRWSPKNQTIELRGCCRTKLESFRPGGGKIHRRRSLKKGWQNETVHFLKFGWKRSDWQGEIFCLPSRRTGPEDVTVRVEAESRESIEVLKREFAEICDPLGNAIRERHNKFNTRMQKEERIVWVICSWSQNPSKYMWVRHFEGQPYSW